MLVCTDPAQSINQWDLKYAAIQTSPERVQKGYILISALFSSSPPSAVQPPPRSNLHSEGNTNYTLGISIRNIDGFFHQVEHLAQS